LKRDKIIKNNSHSLLKCLITFCHVFDIPKLMAIDIRHIRQAEPLARHGNFARAAQELRMTQPDLSRAIKSLQNVLDVQLFDRNIREITPTVYGQHILDFGKTLLRDANRLESDLELLKEGERGIGHRSWTNSH